MEDQRNGLEPLATLLCVRISMKYITEIGRP